MDDTTIAKLHAIKESNGHANLSEAVREAIESVSKFATAMEEASPGHRRGKKPLDTRGLPLEALAAAEKEAQLTFSLPAREAMVRLVAVLSAARPFMIEEAEKETRSRTIQEIIDRAEGHVGAGDVSQLFIDHLKSIK